MSLNVFLPPETRPFDDMAFGGMNTLSWSEHKKSFLADLHSQYKKNVLIDCSIVSMEGRIMGAHRIVLSTCSTVLEVTRIEKSLIFSKKLFSGHIFRYGHFLVVRVE